MAEFIMNKDFGLTVAASILTSVGLDQNHLNSDDRWHDHIPPRKSNNESNNGR